MVCCTTKLSSSSSSCLFSLLIVSASKVRQSSSELRNAASTVAVPFLLALPHIKVSKLPFNTASLLKILHRKSHSASYSLYVKYVTLATLLLSVGFGFLVQSYMANSSKSVITLTFGLALHPYLRT